LRNAERILAAYAEAEPWKADHDAAMRSLEMEEIVAVGNMAYEVVSYIDATWQDYVAAGRVSFDEGYDRQIGDLYRTWLEISDRKLDDIGSLAREGYEIRGVDAFRTHLEEARAILASRDLEPEMRPIEEVLPLVKGNPRPERYGE
jgi:hypothetical protein